MSPLQKIAMGLVLVFVPADFEIAHHVYDALPDPVGWLMVVSGLQTLRTRAESEIDVDIAYWFAWVALVVSVPLYVPQLTELLPHPSGSSTGVDPSVQWFLFLPQAVFSLLLVKAIGQAGIAQSPRDVFVAGRYGVLTWAFIATIVLPPIAYGGGVEKLIDPTLIGIGLVNVAFIYYLFRVHRRAYLGGPPDPA